jgi:uncharacterized OB-fold protein
MNTTTSPGDGVIYTETIVHAPPEQFATDAPYQLVVVTLDAGGRLTTRIDGERVQIGDAVEFVEFRNGIPFYKKRA